MATKSGLPGSEKPSWMARDHSPFDRGGLGRRSFLKAILGTIGAGITAGIAVPIVGYFISPARASSKRTNWTKLGPIEGFNIGEPKLLNFGERTKDAWLVKQTERAIWVVRKSETEFEVFNPRCTHLGCAVNWADSGQNKGRFVSPCHNGIYDIDGKVLSGPPPRPLDTLPWKVEQGNLSVVYKEFKIGVTHKVEL